MKKIISLGTFLLYLTSLLLQPALIRAAAGPELVIDRDGDGLPDALETAGWRSAAGGPFLTDPLNPDSDGDGLTDGEEKLFETIPVNGYQGQANSGRNSPGLWVEYQDDFLTRQYYHPTNNAEPFTTGGGPDPVRRGGGYLHWAEGGSRRILPEAIVVRRGTTFRLHGPPGATLVITKQNPGQSNLTVNNRLCWGTGWDITVDAAETVGTYQATATLGGWSDTIPIHVIFELPQLHNGGGFDKLTQADIEAFLYDDDPTNLRDETAVWWIPRETRVEYTCADHPGQPCDDEPYKTTRSFAQAFWTDQFKKYIFRDRVMPAISGSATQTSAADRLAKDIDDEIRVWYSGIGESTFRALGRTWDGTGYYMGSPDNDRGGWGCDVHAAVLSGHSRAAGIVARTFQIDWTSSADIGGVGAYHGEGAVGGWNDNSVLVWNNGNWRVLRAYSTQELNDPYYPWNEDGTHVSPTDLTTWGRNRYPDKKGDLIVTAGPTWQFSDLNTVWPPWDDLDGTNGNFSNNWEYLWESRKPLQIRRNPMVMILNETFWKGDAWKPDDFNPGVYVLPPGLNLDENWPYDPVATGCPPGLANCPFGNTLLSSAPEVPPEVPPEPVEGPVEGLAEGSRPEPVEGPVEGRPAEGTGGDLSDNTHEGAKFTGKNSHSAIDTDGDRLADAILVQLGLQITKPGRYTVLADLYNANNDWIGTSTWTGSGGSARLQFDQAVGQPGPYTLRGVYLMGELGEDYDARSEITLSALSGLTGPARIGLLPSGGVGPRGLTMTFNHSTPDPDGDGKLDSLVINAGMTISQGGVYRLEGWLVAANGELVAWAQSPPVSLNPGNSSLSLAFDGRAINDRGLPGPYTLQELKVLDGNTAAYNVLDKLQETGLTLNYNPEQFETTAVFSDHMEDGTDQWNWAGLWDLYDKAFYTPGHSWRANTGSNGAGSLTTLTVDTSRHASPALRFQSCTEAGGNTAGLVEISTTGGNTWTQLGAYATADEDWTTKFIDLSNFEKQANLQLRFRATTGNSSSLKWHIDDVHLNAWPGITGVTITRNPPGPITPLTRTFTFTAGYTTLDTSLPISYEWRIDGVVRGTGPTLTYTFGDPNLTYQVQLAVSNPYDTETATQSVGGGTPVTGADFTYTPPIPVSGTSLDFNGSHLPLDATDNALFPLTYLWDFGDGITATGKTPSHSYTVGGNYSVKLTVSNELGTAITSKLISVRQPLTAVSFTHQPSLPREGNPVNFSAGYLPTTASKPISYTWNFGDNTGLKVTTNQTISHTFSLLGNYTVWLTGTNAYGPPVAYSGTITITGQPVTGADFTVVQATPASATMGTLAASYLPGHATNRPPNHQIKYTWNFGDGTAPVNTTTPALNHTFPSTGTYTVTLTVFNGFGSPVIVQKQVQVPFDDDGDGLNNALEISLGTDPQNPDSDGDGLSDGAEVNGYIYDGYPDHPDYGQIITTDPLNPDSDADGVVDGNEAGQGSHPNDPDTDDDGLSDGVEYDPGGGTTTSPINQDTDGDGIPDAIEVGPDPNNPRNTDGDNLIDGVDPDSDNDGIPDAAEWDIDGNSSTADDLCSNLTLDTDGDGIPNCQDNDSDGDGLPNYQDTDSDGDGLPDKEEGSGDQDNDGVANFLDRDIPETFLPLLKK